MDRRKHKSRNDEFDILENQYKKNKNTKEEKQQNSNILPPVIKNKKSKKIVSDESTDDSDSRFSSDSFDDTDSTFSTDTDTDDEKRKKNREKSKESKSKSQKEKSKERKSRKEKIKSKSDSKREKSRKDKKIKSKNIYSKSEPKIVSQNISRQGSSKYYKNRNNTNNNITFVDPSTIFENPLSVLSQNILDEKEPVKNNLSNVSDYQVHESQKIIIEKSMNIINSNNNFKEYDIKLPTKNSNGNYFELLNLSNITPTYKFESQNKIISSDEIHENIYTILNPPKNIKLLFHNDEWIIIK